MFDRGGILHLMKLEKKSTVDKVAKLKFVFFNKCSLISLLWLKAFYWPYNKEVLQSFPIFFHQEFRFVIY